jgi:hypothetical protein
MLIAGSIISRLSMSSLGVWFAMISLNVFASFLGSAELPKRGLYVFFFVINVCKIESHKPVPSAVEFERQFVMFIKVHRLGFDVFKVCHKVVELLMHDSVVFLKSSGSTWNPFGQRRMDKFFFKFSMQAHMFPESFEFSVEIFHYFFVSVIYSSRFRSYLKEYKPLPFVHT